MRKPEEIDGWMRDNELAWIREQAAKCSLIIEIGSYRGRSTRAWADHMIKPMTIICVDPWLPSKDGYYDGQPDYDVFAQNMEPELLNGSVTAVRSTSDAAVEYVANMLGPRKVDLLFIDGDHTGPAVGRDIDNYSPFVREGGIISGHDYDKSHGGLRRAVDKRFGSDVKLTPSKTQAIWWVTK